MATALYRSDETIYIVFLILAAQLLITNANIDGINNIVIINQFDYPLMNWLIFKPKPKIVGNPIRLLIAKNVLQLWRTNPISHFKT
ncbi:hypothetical protein [Lactiplantibacillus plantarum]|uniref:hypothetical protein n=1 Tax=Lactiplantibacillus plantarum TaxID=1590 RepID=UPI002012A41E|nr:hypothetical protein [Lactiplantibacillus plantarum]